MSKTSGKSHKLVKKVTNQLKKVQTSKKSYKLLKKAQTSEKSQELVKKGTNQ